MQRNLNVFQNPDQGRGNPLINQRGADVWVQCESSRFPGLFYYHNKSKGLSVWSMDHVNQLPQSFLSFASTTNDQLKCEPTEPNYLFDTPSTFTNSPVFNRGLIQNQFNQLNTSDPFGRTPSLFNNNHPVVWSKQSIFEPEIPSMNQTKINMINKNNNTQLNCFGAQQNRPFSSFVRNANLSHDRLENYQPQFGSFVNITKTYRMQDVNQNSGVFKSNWNLNFQNKKPTFSLNANVSNPNAIRNIKTNASVLTYSPFNERNTIVGKSNTNSFTNTLRPKTLRNDFVKSNPNSFTLRPKSVKNDVPKSNPNSFTLRPKTVKNGAVKSNHISFTNTLKPKIVRNNHFVQKHDVTVKQNAEEVDVKRTNDVPLFSTDLRHVLRAKNRNVPRKSIEGPDVTMETGVTRKTIIGLPPPKATRENNSTVIKNNIVKNYENQNDYEMTNDEDVTELDASYLKTLASPDICTKRWYIVVNLDVLVSELNFIDKLVKSDPTCRLIVPYIIKKQLESDSLGSSLHSPNAMAARKIIRYLERELRTKQHVIGQKLISSDVEAKGTEYNVLDLCRRLIGKKSFVILLTDNESLSLKGKEMDIICFSIDTIRRTLKREKFTNAPTKIKETPKSVDENVVKEMDDLTLTASVDDRGIKRKVNYVTTDFVPKVRRITEEVDSDNSSVNNNCSLPTLLINNDDFIIHDEKFFEQINKIDKEIEGNKIDFDDAVTDIIPIGPVETGNLFGVNMPMSNSYGNQYVDHNVPMSDWDIAEFRNNNKMEADGNFVFVDNMPTSDYSSAILTQGDGLQQKENGNRASCQNVPSFDLTFADLAKMHNNMSNSFEEKVQIFQKNNDSFNALLNRANNNNNNLPKMFRIENENMRNNLEKRIDEWLCRFHQTMENVLSEYLMSTDSVLKSLLPCSLMQMLECLKEIHDESSTGKVIEQLIEALNRETRDDKFNKDISPNSFMEIFAYGYQLVKNLMLLKGNDVDLATGLDSLGEFLNDIRNSNFTMDEIKCIEIGTSAITRECLKQEQSRKRVVIDPYTKVMDYLNKQFPHKINSQAIDDECVERVTTVSNHFDASNLQHKEKERKNDANKKNSKALDTEKRRRKSNEINEQSEVGMKKSFVAPPTLSERNGDPKNVTATVQYAINRNFDRGVIESVVRKFFNGISQTFLSIQSFVYETIEQLHDQPNNEVSLEVQNKVKSLHGYVTNIIQSLRSVISKENKDPQRSLKNILIKCHLIELLKEDVRFSRYSAIVSKCLEQALILEDSLNILIKMLADKEDNIRFSINTKTNNYVNIFEK